jgi:hypothetical protein
MRMRMSQLYYVEKVMMNYSNVDSYIVMENCHKHDCRVCYDGFNDRG